MVCLDRTKKLKLEIILQEFPTCHLMKIKFHRNNCHVWFLIYLNSKDNSRSIAVPHYKHIYLILRERFNMKWTLGTEHRAFRFKSKGGQKPLKWIRVSLINHRQHSRLVTHRLPVTNFTIVWSRVESRRKFHLQNYGKNVVKDFFFNFAFHFVSGTRCLLSLVLAYDSNFKRHNFCGNVITIDVHKKW